MGGDSGSRPRPTQKTPAQKEALENAFQVNKFPDEAYKHELATTLGLTDQQVNVSNIMYMLFLFIVLTFLGCVFFACAIFVSLLFIFSFS